MDFERTRRRRPAHYLRSSRACTHCRSRKVRCDLIRKGSPCTNCEIDKVLCVDNKRFKRRLDQEVAGDDYGQDASTTLQTDLLREDITRPATTYGSLTHSLQTPTAESTWPMHFPQSPLSTAPGTETEFPRNLYLAEDPNASVSIAFASADEQGPFSGTGQTQMPTPHTHAVPSIVGGNSSLSARTRASLPAYINDFTDELAAEDFAFLEIKGVWDVPAMPALLSSISGFVDYVYPLTPLLDLHVDLECIATDGSSGKISLILLYAIILAGIPFMDDSPLEDAGFSSQNAFSKEIYRRIRLLYDFDCEQDRLRVIQCLILLTYYHEDTDGQKHLRHWLSIAYRLAVDICLNHESPADAKNPHQHRLWKRLWWCLFIRDRACAIGMRQYSLISDEHCLWSDMTISDFDVRASSPAVSATFSSSQFLLNKDLQHQLADVCIAQAGLWKQLDQIMRLRYHCTSPLYGNTRETTLIMVLKSTISDPAVLKGCDTALSTWSAQFWDRIVCEQEASLKNKPSLLMTHNYMVRLLYHMLMCALHRKSQHESDSRQGGTQKPDPFKARSNAAQILSVFEHIQWRNLLHLVPGWSVTVLMQAALTLKDFTEENPDRVCRKLQDCIEILRGLRNRHLHASFGMNLLTSFIALRKRSSMDMAIPSAPQRTTVTATESLSAVQERDRDQPTAAAELTHTTGVVVDIGSQGASDTFFDLSLTEGWDPPSSWFVELLDQNL